MPSIIVDYVAGSGFCPLLSGNPWIGWSGHIGQNGLTLNQYPVGGMQLRADRNNSGNIYVSLSGAFAFSGQVGMLVGSGGPTINSGPMFHLSGTPGSGFGSMDAMQLGPGDAYFLPKICFSTLVNPGSGALQVCIGTDTACSGGFARVYFETF